jgi:hypothetical protein
LIIRSTNHVNRLDESEVAYARQERLKDVQMWSIIREFVLYFIFLSLIFMITYSNHDQNSFLQVNHLRKYFLNTRQVDMDYTKVCCVFVCFFFE